MNFKMEIIGNDLSNIKKLQYFYQEFSIFFTLIYYKQNPHTADTKSYKHFIFCCGEINDKTSNIMLIMNKRTLRNELSHLS